MNTYHELSLSRLTGLRCTITSDSLTVQSCVFETNEHSFLYVLTLVKDNQELYLVSRHSLFESALSIRSGSDVAKSLCHIAGTNALCAERNIQKLNLHQCLTTAAKVSPLAGHPAVIEAVRLSEVIARSLECLTAEEMNDVTGYIPLFQTLVGCHPSWDEEQKLFQDHMTLAARLATTLTGPRIDLPQDAILPELVPSCYMGLRCHDNSRHSEQVAALTEMKAQTPSGTLYFALLSQRGEHIRTFTVATESILPAMAVLSDSANGESSLYLDLPLYSVAPFCSRTAEPRHFSGKWKFCYRRVSGFATHMAYELLEQNRDRLVCLNFH